MKKTITAYRLKDKTLLDLLEKYKGIENKNFTFQEYIIANFNIDISNGLYNDFIETYDIKVINKLELTRERMIEIIFSF
jgi:hypothetical protein